MATKSRKSAKKPSDKQLRELIEEATVDCYDEEEQITALMEMIADHLDLPFETQVLGVEVAVETVEIPRGREIVAVCRRGDVRQAISLADLPLPSPPPEGAEWVAAYRYWASQF